MMWPLETGMFNSEVTALLRTVLDEVCAGMAEHEAGKKVRVASMLLESALRGERDADALRSIGRQALQATPSLSG
jgi:transcription termination factor Rho